MLLNFLGKTGHSKDQIEEIVKQWNKKNAEPLRENYVVGHLRYFMQKKERIVPPNCRGQYVDLQICKPDNLCDRIKNPVSYARRKIGGQSGRPRKSRKNT